MSSLVVAGFAVPLVASAVSLLVPGGRRGQRSVTAVALAASLAASSALVAATADGTVVATRIGGWPPGLAVVLAADAFTALMLTVMVGVTAVCVVAACRLGEDAHRLAHPVMLVLIAGVSLSLVTTDLFNLFVAFEVMLIASYVLLTLPGGSRELRAGVVYVTVNLTASTLLLAGVALVYASSGTVAMAALPAGLDAHPTSRLGLSLIVVAVVVKAGVVPLHAWLPRAYAVVPTGFAALFAALLTKVGVVVLYRFAMLGVFDTELARSALAVVAVVTMVVGGLSALGVGALRSVLGFTMIASTGLALLPVAVASPGAWRGGVVYLLQTVVAAAGIFLVAAALESRQGRSELAELTGAARGRPALVVAFALTAATVVGLPPTVGFVGKYLVVLATFQAGATVVAIGAIAAALASLAAMIRIVNRLALSVDTDDGTAAPAVNAGGRTASGAALLLGIVLLAAGMLGGPLVTATLPAAEALMDPVPYLDVVGVA